MERLGRRWSKAKLALGLNLCIYVPKRLTNDEEDDENDEVVVSKAETTDRRKSNSNSNSNSTGALLPTTPIPTSSGLRRSSKRTCAICLDMMKPGYGHALFTAECSHTFHFHCIASNVKHGNQLCPICRAKWKEVPFRGLPTSDSSHTRGRGNAINWPQDDGHMNIVRRLPRANSSRLLQNPVPLFNSSEPALFNDDEPLDSITESAKECQQQSKRTVEMRTYPEFSAIPQSNAEEDFSVLIHLKAPLFTRIENSGTNITGSIEMPSDSRAAIDLVTVLDISGSMSGTKLALLKRAMGFVIQNLSASDRLSVIAFSSTARRLFPLRRMSDSGRQEAMQAINLLAAGGGTNIADGLRKGSKVIEDRKEKNPVCSIILLSDGQDTYTLVPTTGGNLQMQLDYSSLVPIYLRGDSGHQVPVHVFGFGADHDSVSMHSISETSGGTFSFIEAEGAIQDAFAQCIGGLLSVAAQEMHVSFQCVHPSVHICSIKSGSYASQVSGDLRSGSIVIGDLYADEERDFLVAVIVPASSEDTVLLEVHCVYQEPVTKESVALEAVEVKVARPLSVVKRTMSIEVDRQRNRLLAAEAMAKARGAAERGDLSEAVLVLKECRKKLSESLAGQSGDRLCLTLDTELKETEERMTSRQRYEESGRAYVLSGLSSHSWQRATTRGNSTEIGSHFQSYQTTSMVDMLHRSQTMAPVGHRQTLQHVKSFPARIKPW